MTDTKYFPKIVSHAGLRVVRDDLVPGGTKHAVLLEILPEIKEEELVYTSPAHGYAQLALTLASKEVGKRVTIFTPERKELGALAERAAKAGATIRLVPYGRLSVLKAWAKAYCEARPGRLLCPFGLTFDGMEEAVTRRAHQALQGQQAPSEVWATAGTGLLSRALQAAWPKAAHYAVRVGMEPECGGARVLQAPEKFEEKAEERPPWDSSLWYDAKMWQFIKKMAKKGAVVWNVAG